MLRRIAFVLLLVVPGSLPSQAPAVATTADTTLARGVTYSHLKETSPAGEPWSIHVLRIDRREKSVAIRAVNGAGPLGEMQRELPTALAHRAAAGGATVYAVVNGDYDLPGENLGVSDGLSVSSSRLWTTGKSSWPTFAITTSGAPLIGLASTSITFRAGKRDWPVASVNKPNVAVYGSPAAARVYTREYRPIVKDNKPFAAIVVSDLSRALPLPADGAIRGRVREVVTSATEVKIPVDAFVVALPTSALAPAPQVGQRVELRLRVRVGGQRVREAIGGFPVIVKTGKPGVVGQTNDNLPRRHPRTAVCYNDREIIFTVVDGRQTALSVGMTLVELADLMARLGCTEAMNTDGGGSSVMAIAAPPQKPANNSSATSSTSNLALQTSQLRIVNSPSDGRERGRGNAFLIVRK